MSLEAAIQENTAVLKRVAALLEEGNKGRAEALAALPTEERAGREAAARARLADAGAHVVIPSIAALPAAVRALGDRIRAGERPG